MKSFYFLLLLTGSAGAQIAPDAALARAMDDIKAIDNHAHPLRYVETGQKPDDEYDALPCDTLEPSPAASRLRTENPEWIAAWRSLYRYPFHDAGPEHRRELQSLKAQVMHTQGSRYPAFVLDASGIDIMLANRIAMGEGLTAPRFRWVPFADALLFPLNNEGQRKQSPDRRVFYGAEERLLRRYLSEAELGALPSTLDGYLVRLITPTLERQRRDGAVAVKFEAAYLRSLDFAGALKAEVEAVYARYYNGGEPPAGDYKKLQDFLFRYIAREAGRLGLAVHIHTGPGCGGYFQLRDSNPTLLESAFHDPALQKTSFVMIHAASPFGSQVGALLASGNVYADFSNQTTVMYPHGLAAVLREWLEAYPEKVLFGSDAFANDGDVNWPETAWLSARTAREALALALTGMMNDREITRERAMELARMVLRGNAMKLYGWKQ